MKKYLFLLVILVCATAGGQETKVREIRIDGSTTVGPICDAFVEAFTKKYPGQAFAVKKTGSGDGAAALVEGRCEIAAMSRAMKPEEFREAVAGGKMPVSFTVAMDGVCLIVHPANTIRELTGQQVRDIYSGKITNWREVGGPNLPIVAISRDTSSGTYGVFHEIAMRKTKLGDRVEYANANPAIFNRVATTKGAIGYVGLGFVKTGVAAVKYDGILPAKATIATGRYALARPLLLYTDGHPPLGSRLLEFCNYYLTEQGAEIIEAKGFVPMTEY